MEVSGGLACHAVRDCRGGRIRLQGDERNSSRVPVTQRREPSRSQLRPRNSTSTLVSRRIHQGSRPSWDTRRSRWTTVPRCGCDAVVRRKGEDDFIRVAHAVERIDECVESPVETKGSGCELARLRTELVPNIIGGQRFIASISASIPRPSCRQPPTARFR